MTKIKVTNLRLEDMAYSLKPALEQRNKLGYIAARNARVINTALTEYYRFKEDLIRKYGKPDEKTETISIRPGDSNFPIFAKELSEVGSLKQEVELMTTSSEDVIGILNGREILALDWMLTEVNNDG